MTWLTTPNQHGVPRWVLLLGGLLALFGTLIGAVAFFGPDTFAGEATGDGVTGLARSWGARNAALALAMGAAVAIGRREALLVSFTGAVVREIGDTFNGLVEADGTAPIAIVVLILDLLVLWTLRSVPTVAVTGDQSAPSPA